MSKTILVTGATAGFGAAIANKFAKQGWNIIATGRRQDRLDALAAELGDVKVHTSTFDVRDKQAVDAFAESLPEEFSNIDLLVNNAGLALGLEPAHACDMDDWECMVDTNIKGLMYVTRALLPRMVERGTGHVVNLGSIAGSYPYPGANVYGATKAFVRQFSLNLRADLIGTGVRVTNVEPGMAESEFSLVRFKGDAEKAGQVYKGTQPLTPEDIADVVQYVANAPEHVNVNTIEIMPTVQAFGHFPIHRD